MEGGFDDCLNFLHRDFGDTTRTGCILLQSLQSKSQKPLSPKLHGRSGDTKLLCNILVLHSIHNHSDDQCTLYQSQWKAFSTNPDVLASR